VSEFFEMGGYARFVWPAFGLTAVVLIGNALAAVRGHRRALDAVRDQIAAGEREE